MSKRVLFVCLAFCVIGLLACWDVVHALMAGRVHLSVALGILFLPIGFGLLLGSPLARTAASGLFILSYLVCGWILLMPLFITASAAIKTGGREATWMTGYPTLFTGVSSVAAVLGLLHWLLYSPAFDAHLEEGQN